MQRREERGEPQRKIHDFAFLRVLRVSAFNLVPVPSSAPMRQPSDLCPSVFIGG